MMLWLTQQWFDPEIIRGWRVFDPRRQSNATETYYDGVDASCDGLSDFDQDGDGFASSEFPNRDGVIEQIVWIRVTSSECWPQILIQMP